MKEFSKTTKQEFAALILVFIYVIAIVSPWSRFFTVFEGHLDPRVAFGVGFSWSGTRTLVGTGARPSASITDTLSAF